MGTSANPASAIASVRPLPGRRGGAVTGRPGRGIASPRARALALVLASAVGFGRSALADCPRRGVVARATTNDPAFTREGSEVLLLSLRAYIGEVLTSPSFHLLSKETVDQFRRDDPQQSNKAGTNYHKPEYDLKADWRIGLSEPREGKKPVASRLTIDLTFKGEPEELVRSWSTLSAYESYEGQVAQMFHNRHGGLHEARPVERILWDFERTPISCEVEVKAEKPLRRGQEVELVVRGCRDREGRPSKPFNRLLLQVRHGKILNGTPLEAASEMKAFRLGSGTVTVKYQAPTDADVSEDVLWINSSCEILPESVYPLSRSDLLGMIKEEKLPIKAGIVAQLTESSSGKCTDGTQTYPFAYTVSMRFEERLGGARPGLTAPGPAGALKGAMARMRMPPEIAELPGSRDARLVAELHPVESSMKVGSWSCSDPEYSDPPPARFGRGRGGDVEGSPPAQLWLVGDSIYVVRGFVGGVFSYFASWDDDAELSGTKPQPAGARVAGTWGDMGKYLKIPQSQCADGKTVTLTRSHTGDDGVAWSWTTSWTIRLAF